MTRFVNPKHWAGALVHGDPFPVSDWDGLDVDSFPRSEYSIRDIRRAGEVLAGSLVWTDETAPKIREAFHIANNWRDAHAFPMRSVRYQMRWFMREQKIDGICAARLKRMQAIRGKLLRPNFDGNLTQIQDLGGCRAILPTIADVRKLVGAIRDRSRHELWKEDPYIDEPKADGYRSHHLRYKFRGKGPDRQYDGLRVEIQVRTKLQHSWATAVEAVGMLRHEGLKNHHGSPDWLRLFTLMSAEIAEAEGCPLPTNVPSKVKRLKEIKELDDALKAYDALENIGYALWWSQDAIAPQDRVSYYLIKFDNEARRATVEPYYKPLQAIDKYDSAEQMDNESGKNTTNVVLVEADKVQSLHEAYPNYFGDVQLFKGALRAIISGGTMEEYTLMLQERVVASIRENKDNKAWGWWFNKRNRRWR